MKKLIQKSAILLTACALSATTFAQLNQSNGTVPVTITPAATALGGANIEAFRFRPGLVTGIENPLAPTTTNILNFTPLDQWFSLGRLNAPTQTLYGLRIQRAGRGLAMGFTGPVQPMGATPTLGNAFIEWIGNTPGGGPASGNLDFRFSDDPTSAAPTTVLKIERAGGGIANTYAQNGLLGHYSTGTFGALSNADKWIGIGSPIISGVPSPNLYGNRTQWEGQAMIFALRQDAGTSEKNAIVEWGNQGGSMDFRYINNPTNPSGFTQILRLTNVGNAEVGVQSGGLPGYFEPKLAVNSSFRDGIAVRSEAGTGIDIKVRDRAGILVNVSKGIDNQGEAYGIQTQVAGAEFQNFGLYGIADDNTVPSGWKNNYGTRSIARNGTGTYGVEAIAEDGQFFNWGIYSRATSSSGTAWNAAGYFDGDVWANNFNWISDRRVKKDIQTENSALATIMKLRPVNYTMTKGETSIETFSKKLQHGFIAQEVQEILPELVSVAKHPVYENGKMTRAEDILTVNYVGVIPLLTKAVQELRQEVELLKTENKRLQEIEVVKPAEGPAQSENKESAAYKLSQNIPNPFSGITSINYTIPFNERNATLLITDLSGKLLKQYRLNGGSNTLSLSASDTGKGIFLYSLVANGTEKITRRMIVQ
jgi:hypothetical protein